MLDKFITFSVLIALINILGGFILTQISGQILIKAHNFKERIGIVIYSGFIYLLLLSVFFHFLPDENEHPFKFFGISVAVLILIVLSFILLYRHKNRYRIKSIINKKQKKNKPITPKKNSPITASIPQLIISKSFNTKKNQSVSLELPQIKEIKQQDLHTDLFGSKDTPTQQEIPLEKDEQPIHPSTVQLTEQSIPNPSLEKKGFNDSDNTDEFNSTVSPSEQTNPISNTSDDDVFGSLFNDDIDSIDTMLEDAIKVVFEAGQASTSLLQRRLRLGYGRAGRLIDTMEQMGIVGPHEGSMYRKVLMTEQQWTERKVTGNITYKSKIEKAVKDPIDERLDDLSKFIQSLKESISKNRKTDEEIAEEIKEKIGIEVDYTDDGYFFDKIENMVIPKSEESMQINFIDSLIRYASIKTMKLILASNDLSYDRYKEIPHLLVPVISTDEKTVQALNWAFDEFEQRIKELSLYNVRNIKSYNKMVTTNLNTMTKEEIEEEKEKGGEIVDGEYVPPKATTKMPYIIVVIQEMYSISKISEIDDKIIRILLNSQTSGIYLFFFSKFSKKNLSLGMKEDLLKVGKKEDLEEIFDKDKSSNIKLSDIGYIDEKMSGYEFELFCGKLLEYNGFKRVKVTQASNDYGVDIIAFKDDIKYAIQCKKYSSPVGVTAVQEIIASKSMYDCHIAVVLTNNTFTNSAKTLAEKNGVLLWGRDKLQELMEIHESQIAKKS